MKKAIIHQHYPLDYAGEEALNSICTNLAFIGTDKRKIVITSNSPVSYTHLTLPTNSLV